jgi:nucleotidyltransferase/DNA polymerase involved in DNA repair
MPVACLRIPWFALRIALLERPELAGQPLVLGNPQGGRPVVLDASPEALAAGVRPGMNLTEAQALCPKVVILTPDPVRETTVVRQVTTQLDDLSPLVEPASDDPGTWYIDLAGLERHHGTQHEATRRILACADPMLQPQAGVAANRFAARVAAIVASPGDIRSVPATETVAFLSRAPIDCLPLPVSTIRQLERLGIPTLGDFTRIPARKIAARFGPSGRHAWELASGRDTTPVTPPPQDQEVHEHLVMPAPTTSRDMLLIGLRQMVGRAFSKPQLCHRQVRQVTIQAILEGDRRSWERTLTLKEPTGHDRIVRALQLRLQDLELDGPVESLTLIFSGLSHAIARQASLSQMGTRATVPLIAAVHQLKHRYGESPLYHVVEVEPWSRIPERRHALISYDP